MKTIKIEELHILKLNIKNAATIRRIQWNRMNQKIENYMTADSWDTIWFDQIVYDRVWINVGSFLRGSIYERQKHQLLQVHLERLQW